MKFKIFQKDLNKAVNIAQRAISMRSPMEILQGLKFEAKDGYLTIYSTDLEISIITRLEAKIEEEGSLILNNRLIGDIVRKLESSEISFESNGNMLSIECEKSKFNIKCIGAEDFPSFENFRDAEGEKLEIKTGELKNIIKKTLFAALVDEIKPVLNGVLFNMKGNTKRFVALDGYRIAMVKKYDEEDVGKSFVIPNRMLFEIQKILQDEDEEVLVGLYGNKAVFRIENTLIYCNLLEGEFYDYNFILEMDFDTEVKLSRKELINALERIYLIGREEKTGMVSMNFKGSILTLKSENELGEVKEDIDIEKVGGDFVMGLNIKYLMEGLKVMEEDNISIKIKNPDVIMLIRENENYDYYVLPIRLHGEQ